MNRSLLLTTAGLLHSASQLLPLHLLLTALGAWRIHNATAAVPWLLLTLYLAALHLRIHFDAAIFRYWQENENADHSDLDAALQTLHLCRPREKPPNITERCHGALRLCRRLICTTLIQVAFIAMLLACT